jgi:hypothetical protein
VRRSFVVTSVFAALAGACAMIAGLDDPGDAPSDTTDAQGDSVQSNDVTSTDAPADGGSPTDAADAGRCVGTIMKKDSFEDRDAIATDGWELDSNGSNSLIEITGGRLHAKVEPTTTAQNFRRHLLFGRPNVKRLCVSYTVSIVMPQNTSAYFDSGDTAFGFVQLLGPDGGDNYHGIGVRKVGPNVYVEREGGTNEQIRTVSVPLTTKWNVFMEADYVADTVTIEINGKAEKFSSIRPSPPLPTANVVIGVRNFGPTPEAEAFFDDVVIGIDQ